MLEQAVIIGLIVYFIHMTMMPGMIFGFIGDYGDYIVERDTSGRATKVRWPNWLRKPLYACNICMSPWYGTAAYLIAYHHSFLDWFLTVGAAAGLNAVIAKVAK